MVQLPRQPHQAGEIWTLSTRAREWCWAMWALCSAHWNRKLGFMFPQLPKVQLYSLGRQSVSTWGRNALLPVPLAVLAGFFTRVCLSCWTYLSYHQLTAAWRETTWNKTSLKNNLKEKSNILRWIQKSIARDHHKRETLTQAREQGCFKLPIPSQQKQCFHLYPASKWPHFWGLQCIWDGCAVCTYLLFLLSSPGCHPDYPPHLQHEQEPLNITRRFVNIAPVQSSSDS